MRNEMVRLNLVKNMESCETSMCFRGKTMIVKKSASLWKRREEKKSWMFGNKRVNYHGNFMEREKKTC